VEPANSSFCGQRIQYVEYKKNKIINIKELFIDFEISDFWFTSIYQPPHIAVNCSKRSLIDKPALGVDHDQNQLLQSGRYMLKLLAEHFFFCILNMGFGKSWRRKHYKLERLEKHPTSLPLFSSQLHPSVRSGLIRTEPTLSVRTEWAYRVNHSEKRLVNITASHFYASYTSELFQDNRTRSLKVFMQIKNTGRKDDSRYLVRCSGRRRRQVISLQFAGEEIIWAQHVHPVTRR